MLTCLIVDDETPAREELKYMLKDIEDIVVLGEASNGVDAIKLIDSLAPDMVFLDIEMPEISGIDVAKMLAEKDKNIDIIFVTAYDNFAVDAFDVNAIDYLLKPISKERLYKAIDRINLLKEERKDIGYHKLKSIIEDIEDKKHKNLNRISVYHNNKLFPIDTKEIIYATIEDKSTIIVTASGKYKLNISLNELIDKMPRDTFFRSHKSYIVNLDMIESIVPWFNYTYNINFKDIKESIPVSRSHIKDFKDKMNIE